jgi:hypothetical protein
MPRSSNSSSSHNLSSSQHVPYRYINLEFCMNTLLCQEDIATAIRLTNNERSVFVEILFLDHLFQTIR